MLDERTFDASHSKQLQLFRATLMIAIAAQIGERSVETADADAFARQLAEASREVNYAAVDAGFGVPGQGDTIIPTCKIGRGFISAASEGWDERGAYAADDTTVCSGYYVNFESHIARIEGRVIRAMLTSLPTEKARKFLEKLSDGNVLSALWSLTQTFGDLAVAFHSGAGVYRAGTENLAALTQGCYGDPSYPGEKPAGYDEEWHTVVVASRCLGLSRKDLFDGDAAGASALPVKLPPTAFHALFRIARTACVDLPLENSTQIDPVNVSRSNRQIACGMVQFAPQRRPLDIEIDAQDDDDQDDDDQDEGGRAEEQPAVPTVPGVPPPPP